jgi:hypothetical protein
MKILSLSNDVLSCFNVARLLLLLTMGLPVASCLQEIPTGMGDPCADDSDCRDELMCATDIEFGYFEDPYTCLLPCTDDNDCRFGERGQYVCSHRASGSEPAACVEDIGK